MKRLSWFVFFAVTFSFFSGRVFAQNASVPSQITQQGVVYKKAPKPLFRDPVFDGAADPVVVYNLQAGKWFMYYTNRRANIADPNGVAWVHGTRIGIAESSDGATWTYRDTCNIDYRPHSGYTHWAPEVIEVDGMYHMFLTYVPGIFTDWNHPREIVHLTSKDGINWVRPNPLKLFTDKVIDACVLRLPGGSWRMWYNNERDGKSVYYADSPDLYSWTDKGKANMSTRGEGPKAFVWHGQYWMVVDAWRGLLVYRSPDALNWTLQEELLLDVPGTGLDDGVIGGHPDVVVNQGKVYLFYFTHPGRRPGAPAGQTEQRRSSIQVVELRYENGRVLCNRDAPTYIRLMPE